MSEVSSGRRRLGILAITTTALALPLTASISYAQGEPPEPPMAPQPPAAPLAPAAPQAPEAPAAPSIETVDPDERVFVQIEEEDGQRRVIRHRIRHGDGEGLSEEELEQMMAELEREFEGIDGTIEAAIEIAMAASEEAMEAMEGMEHHRIVMSESEAGLHNLEINCDGGDTVVEQELEDGRRAMVICRAAIRAEAAEGLREARDEIANDPDIPENLREEILRSLDRSLEGMSANEGRQLHRAQAKLEGRAALAPHARASAVAMRWQGRMVSPVRVQAVAPVRATPAVPAVAPAPAADADCEESAVRA